MLKLHSPGHAWNFVNGTKAGRPIGDGQARVIACDQPPGDDQKKSQTSHEDDESVMRGVIRGRIQKYSKETKLLEINLLT
jgi:hypothetical protein